MCLLQGIAKTGSGKTAAFVLPMLVHIMDQPEVEKGAGPIGVIVVPTRELAEQIHKETRRFSKIYQLRVSAAFGGLSKFEQFKDLKGGSEVGYPCTQHSTTSCVWIEWGFSQALNPQSAPLHPATSCCGEMRFQPAHDVSSLSAQCILVLLKNDNSRGLIGVQVAVCTPGRMIDLIKMKACNMLRVTYLVFDEADRMFDMGFEPQVSLDGV